jgi:mono/diheme cytochrome c family protein
MRWSVILILCSLVACEKGGKPPPKQGEVGLTQETGPNAAKTAQGDHAQPTQGEIMFFQVCAQCHGLDGSGRGPVSDTLNPKPRNYTDAKWQASVTDEEIKKTILLGGAGVGKSAMMPPNPKLKDNPAVLDELVQIIRGFGKGQIPKAFQQQ